MRDRMRFEAELVALGLRQAPASLGAEREFEVAAAFEAETPDPLDAYRLLDGLYTPQQKRDAVSNPKGLLLTASVVGRQEQKLLGQGPATLSIGKELTRFENGKLGGFVANFNEFTYYFDEVLRGIGRLRDLLSAGCPEAPKLMTARQKQALRPTDNRSVTGEKKRAYRAWRNAQQLYAVTTNGKLVGGFAHRVAELAESVVLKRQAFWQAQGDLSRTLEKVLDKPTYQMVSLKIADIASVVLADSVAGAASGGLVVLADLLLEARQNRKDYDAKMKEFLTALATKKGLVKDQLGTYQAAGQAYWNDVESLQNARAQRDLTRQQARVAAADFGQSLPPRSESRDPILAEIRMPALIADAWRVLAVNAGPAKTKLTAVIKERELVAKARFHFEKQRPDPWEAEDITRVMKAYNQALSWVPVLEPGQIKIWVNTNQLWDEQFNKFNV